MVHEYAYFLCIHLEISLIMSASFLQERMTLATKDYNYLNKTVKPYPNSSVIASCRATGLKPPPLRFSSSPSRILLAYELK